MSKIKKEYWVILISLSLSVLYVWVTFVRGNRKTSLVILLIIGFCFCVPFLKQFGLKFFLWIAIFLYWIPVGFFSFYLSEILVYFLAFFIFLEALRNPFSVRKIISKLGFGNLPFFLFLIAGILSVFIYGFSSFALLRFRIAVLFPILLLIICINYIGSKKDLVRVINFFLISTSALCILLLWGFFTKSFNIRPDSLGGERLSASIIFPGGGYLIIGEAITASNLAVMVPLAFITFLYGNNLWQRIIGMISLSSAGLVIIYTQGRGGWIGTITALIVMILLNFRLSKFSSWMGLGFLGGILIGCYNLILSIIASSTSNLYSSRVTRLFIDPTNVENLDSRLQNWQYYWSQLVTHPFGLGWEKTYASLFSNELLPYPHNAYLLIGNAMGWIGLVGYLGIIVWLGWKFIPSRKSSTSNNPYIIAGIGSIVAWIVTAITATTGIYDYFGAGMVWLPVTFAVCAVNITKENKHANI